MHALIFPVAKKEDLFAGLKAWYSSNFPGVLLLPSIEVVIVVSSWESMYPYFDFARGFV